ncbi:MAG: patatin-like phospholipase family protein [Pseudomonadota bacterium]
MVDTVFNRCDDRFHHLEAASRNRWAFGACWVLALQLLADPATAQPTAATEPTPTVRPRIALVLSGGGARGFAHVGVLRALKDMRVPIDLVAGVSMGAVVGGAYAAGRSVEEMEQFVRETAWSDIVADRPPRDDLSFRRRADDLLLPSRIEFGLDGSGVSLPLSAAGNASLEAALTRLLPIGTGELPVNRLALPFRSVASDLLSGEAVELNDTPLFMSIRASLAVPGVFAPVRLNNRLVADGGLVRNLPVDVAKAMGADVIIAVNVGTPLSGESELASALGVARQMMLILTEQNVRRSLKELGPRDVLIAPELGGFTFLDFSRGELAMQAGEQAARKMATRLEALAVSPEKYAAWEGARTQASAVRDVALPLAGVEVRATAHASSEALSALTGLRAGDAVTLSQIHQRASRLIGRGEFERVEVDAVDVAGQRQVTLKPVEADWARSRLRLGLEVVSDFADDNRFTVSALHTLSWLNSWGAELRTLARIGSQRILATQLLQPLAPGSAWYVAPSIQYSASSTDVYAQSRRSLRVGYSVATATLAIGRELSNWGDVQLGVERRVGRSRALVPEDDTAANGRFSETASYVQLQVDTLDSLALPSRGVLLQGRFESARATEGAAGRSASSIVALKAFRVGDWDGHVYGEWAKARSGLAPLSLGGFLRLSGTPRESLAGRAVVLGRVVMARRIGEMPAGLGGAVRIGYSLELGTGWDPDESLRFGDLKQAASGFASVDTRFGPLFLALGATRGAGSTLYLFLGPFW